MKQHGADTADCRDKVMMNDKKNGFRLVRSIDGVTRIATDKQQPTELIDIQTRFFLF